MATAQKHPISASNRTLILKSLIRNREHGNTLKKGPYKALQKGYSMKMKPPFISYYLVFKKWYHFNAIFPDLFYLDVISITHITPKLPFSSKHPRGYCDPLAKY